ncbi:MAG: putative transglutaminase-like cysteine proteinase [Motiliproteus sp.]
MRLSKITPITRNAAKVSAVRLVLCAGLLLFPVLAIGFYQSQWPETLQRVVAVYGERAGLRMQAWRDMVQQGPESSEGETLAKVNRFFNQLAWIEDPVLWGEADYWATPLEFLGANGGDCEDFSIAKYLTLIELGIDEQKLRISYVKSIRYNQAHMVVTYYATPSSMPLVLDNIDGEIKPADQRPDLIPVYSFNGKSLWLNRERDRGVLAGPADRLSLWNDLRSRYRVQKLRHPLINLE